MCIYAFQTLFSIYQRIDRNYRGVCFVEVASVNFFNVFA